MVGEGQWTRKRKAVLGGAAVSLQIVKFGFDVLLPEGGTDPEGVYRWQRYKHEIEALVNSGYRREGSICNTMSAGVVSMTVR